MTRWLIGGLAMISVIAFFLLMPRDVANRKQQPSPRQTSQKEIEYPIPEISKPVSEPPERPLASAKTVRPVPAHERPPESERERIRPPQAQGPLKLLKRAYRNDSRDETSQAIERLIRAQFDPKIFPMELLRGVNCHKSVCKIDVLWSEEHLMVLAAVAMNATPLLTGHIAFEPEPEPDRNGYVLIEIYILRPGYDLEDFE